MGSFSLSAQREFTQQLKEELRLASAIADAVPHVREPPWDRHESAKTVFRDVDLKELASSRDEKWRQKTEGKKLPPILAKRVAGALTFEEGPIGGAAAANADGSNTLGLSGMASSRANKHISFAADPGAMNAVMPKEPVKELTVREAAKGTKLRGKKIIRFRYTFRPPPWVLPKGTKRPPNVQAAKDAGVRSASVAGFRKFPLAPAHQRYIEALEESVTALATEAAVRKNVLLKKIEEYLATRWEPPLQEEEEDALAGGEGAGAGGAKKAGKKGNHNPADDSDYEPSSSDDEAKKFAGLVVAKQPADSDGER